MKWISICRFLGKKDLSFRVFLFYTSNIWTISIWAGSWKQRALSISPIKLSVKTPPVFPIDFCQDSTRTWLICILHYIWEDAYLYFYKKTCSLHVSITTVHLVNGKMRNPSHGGRSFEIQSVFLIDGILRVNAGTSTTFPAWTHC